MKPFFKFVLFFISVFSVPAFCQTSDTVIIKEGLVVKIPPFDGNKIIASDPVVAMIETGSWKTPKENASLEYNGKELGLWKKITAGENGWIKDDSLYSSYVYMSYNSDKDGVILLEAMGNGTTYVNGVTYAGNPYRTQDTYEDWGPKFDYSLIPVKVKKGVNDFVFECNRERVLKVKLHKNVKGLMLVGKDLTAPDLIVNQPMEAYGALPIINADEKFYNGLQIKTWIEGSAPEYLAVNELLPLSIYKAPFRIKLPTQNAAGKAKLNIAIVNKNGAKEEVLTSTVVSLNVLNAGDTRKETFISKMDGSVQYYAVNPPQDLKGKPALFLSLHGAGVEAINQAQSYGHKNWGYIVSPTNRRPYGYNWENWGRLDGLEVFEIAKKEFNPDDSRIYLTGHSMGGHGTWMMGINYADKFGAIAPSAGWISIWSYRIKGASDSTEVKKMLFRSTKQSDTYAFTSNLKPTGIYILQGDADDNVPPAQPRSMVENLSKFHKDFVYQEIPGQGHWWDLSDEEGADVVDWPAIFDFFSHHAVAKNDMVKHIDYVTANPAISSKNYWVEILNQTEQQKLSHIIIDLQFHSRKFVGTTSNIEKMSIDASMLTADKPVTVVLDSQIIANVNLPPDKKLFLAKENGKWALSGKVVEENKYPGRCGNFREALNYDVVFVYGTKGNDDENAWAYHKAKSDAEKIWYQGNGSIEVIKDTDFDLSNYKDRSVILFGNSKTNSAWNLLLQDSPLQVSPGRVKLGDKEFKGNDLACLGIRPRKDSKFASVGFISGTGIKGMKLANLAQYSHPYMSFPDAVVYNSEVLNSDEEGVKCAGYYGNDWSVNKGEFIYPEGE